MRVKHTSDKQTAGDPPAGAPRASAAFVLSLSKDEPTPWTPRSW